MREKKYLSMLILMFLMSLALVSMPASPAKAVPPVKFTVGTGTLISCKSAGSTVTVVIYVTDTLHWQGSDGMIQYGFDVLTDPTVLEPKDALGAAAGYYMWEFYNWKVTSEQTDCDPDLENDHSGISAPSIWGSPPSDEMKASGNWSDVSEVYIPAPDFGVGRVNVPPTKYDAELDECVDWTLPTKLITLRFTSKSATAGTWIQLRRCAYRSADLVWHDMLPEDGAVVDGRYCKGSEFPSGVEAAAAIGLMAAITYVWLRKRKTEPTIPKRFITPTSQ